MGRSDRRKHQNEDVLSLQSRQLSETGGAACHEEVCQCPARQQKNVIDMEVPEQAAK